MNLYRPVIALIFAFLLLDAGVLFRWHGMQEAVPKIRTMMPPLSPAVEASHARDMCLSTQPVWENGRTQMDYCMISAGKGDPQAQSVVAQFYLNGTTDDSQAQAYRWLRAAAENRRDRSAAAMARLRLKELVRQLDPETLQRAKDLAEREIPGVE